MTDKLRRICDCGKVFYCSLECGVDFRREDNHFCHCHKCFAKDIRTSNWAKEDIKKPEFRRCPRLKPQTEAFVFR